MSDCPLGPVIENVTQRDIKPLLFTVIYNPKGENGLGIDINLEILQNSDLTWTYSNLTSSRKTR